MTESELIKIFKCLADKSRIQILRSLKEEDMYVERLAERLGLTPATISFHLKKLEEIGTITARREQYYVMYSMNEDFFEMGLNEIFNARSEEWEQQEEREIEYRNKIIHTFFEYGKLKSIPTQKKKERIILEEISKAFQLDKEYTEKEVNILIADFYDDFCTIRKGLVYEGFLDRKDGIYKVSKN